MHALIPKEFMTMLCDWPIGTILGIIIIATSLLMILFVAVMLFEAADSCFLPQKREVGHVIGKVFTPAHSNIIMVYNAAIKASQPTTVTHPDEWSVTVSIKNQQDSISVSEGFFDSLSKDDSVLVEYAIGRFSRNLYIKKLSHV